MTAAPPPSTDRVWTFAADRSFWTLLADDFYRATAKYPARTIGEAIADVLADLTDARIERDDALKALAVARAELAEANAAAASMAAWMDARGGRADAEEGVTA